MRCHCDNAPSVTICEQYGIIGEKVPSDWDRIGGYIYRLISVYLSSPYAAGLLPLTRRYNPLPQLDLINASRIVLGHRTLLRHLWLEHR